MSMRIGGLASGIDTDALIKQMMDARRAPMVKLIQKKQTMEWQREAYRELNTALYDFRNNKLFNFKLDGNLRSRTATVSGDSAALTASPTGSAVNSTMNFEVTTLAKSASKWSTADIRANASFSTTATLSSEDGNLDGNITVTEYKFKINGKEVTVDPAEDSLDEVLARINDETDVSAFFDSSTGKVSFVSKSTGIVNGATKDQAYISFEDTAGDFLNNILKINTATPAANAEAAVNADLKINGMTTTRTTNSFQVNGVNITLLKEGGAKASVTVNTNTDDLVGKVKTFIEDYNNALKTMQDKLNEQRYRDFPPLTSEQKEGMSDKEIEQWEEKAMSGLLKGDRYVSTAINDMRMAIMGQVETGNDDYRTLSSIGIETGEYFENGKLYLKDESKLREAIETDPEAVIALFTANGNGDSDRSDVGIAERMYEDIQKTLDNFVTKAGTSAKLFDDSIMGKQLYDIATEIDAWTERLVAIENRYYRQFTAMEQAISQLNAQSSYLANAFAQ